MAIFLSLALEHALQIPFLSHALFSLSAFEQVAWHLEIASVITLCHSSC
jgi:hypothetical protein